MGSAEIMQRGKLSDRFKVLFSEGLSRPTLGICKLLLNEVKQESQRESSNGSDWRQVLKKIWEVIFGQRFKVNLKEGCEKVLEFQIVLLSQNRG